MGEGRRRYATIRSQMVLDGMTTQGETERQQAAEGTFAKFAAIPAYVVVAMKNHADSEIHEENYAACCCVIQNFLLLAWARGLGTSWKTFKNDARLRDFLGLAADEKVVGIIHTGYPAEAERSGQRQPVRERLTILKA
jgi:nitroreductase